MAKSKLSNREIGRLFRLGGILLELNGENKFKAESYENAYFIIKTYPTPIIDLGEKEIESMPGIGATLTKKIISVQQTGTYEELEKLLASTPNGLIELANIKGIGPKKARSVWQEAGITTPEELLQACEKGSVAKIKGFGAKTQETLKETLEYYFESKGYFMYADAEAEALPLLEALRESKQVKQVELTGEIRRKSLIVNKIELLLEPGNGFKEWDSLIDTGLVEEKDGNLVTGEAAIPVIIYKANADNWVEQWMLTTGSLEHISQLKEDAMKNASDEKDAYAKSGFPYIIPEMREGQDEFAIMAGISEDDIVKFEDIKGCLHNHSNYSDGANTIEEMANTCREMGLEYFGISDHSQAAFYANGMKPYDVLKQFKEVDKLNEKMAPFRIFKGVESDILSDGSLDYEEGILQQFDYVVASVHSNLKMDEAKATKRLITAIENPYTTILGHASSRQLLVRPGFPLDYQKVIDACAANNVIIEINANPRRLDIDWRWINYAVSKGIMLAINPDGHAVDEIINMYYGVCAARKAGLTRDRVLNTLALADIDKLFKAK